MFDSDKILTLDYPVHKLIIYGVGVIGCENGYRIRFVTKEGVENDEEVTGGFKFLLIDLCNAALKGEPADIDLCDEQLKTKSSITYTEAKSYMEQKLLEAQ